MKDLALDIRNLTKRYRISRGKEFNALEDINLTLRRGEVLGLVGHNGAGKSTLLKVLSRITFPSRGEIDVYGSLSSLLEVGTGFHPELTGRENIFLNGSILGMSRAAIKKQFDEIVDFAGVEQFLDMPVKRYSSGMFVRLAFSVAAHLEADILLIDEVLAVGDVDFQKKCLARMDDISNKQERSIIFVSHNMSAILSLCNEVALLEKGKLVHRGKPQETIDRYLENLKQLHRNIPVAQRQDRIGDGRAKITHLEVKGERPAQNLMSGEAASFSLQADIPPKGVKQAKVEIQIYNSRGNFLSSLLHQAALEQNQERIHWKCHVPSLPLMPGDFFLNVHLFLDGQRSDMVGRALYFNVLEEEFQGIDLVRHKQIPGFYLAQKWQTHA